MEGIRGGRIVGVGDQDISDEMQCPQHPYTGNHGGGVCPLCLHDRLRNLVSSSLPPPLRRSYASPSASSDAASPPGFKATTASSSALSLSLHANLDHQTRARAPRIPVEKQKKSSVAYKSSSSSSEIVFKRSKSAVAPSRSAGNRYAEDKRGGFWSFLYPPSTWKPHRHGSRAKDSSLPSSSAGAVAKESALASSSMTTNRVPVVILEDDMDDPMVPQNNGSVSSPESKVSRSRSVGCGSRSFSGDLFERISTGFGDCALRRVESQREAPKPRISASSAVKDDNNKVRCGLIFGSLHSSPHHWVSSSSSSSSSAGRGRTRSWVWSFASPMRASNKPPTHRGTPTTRTQVTESNNSTPDLSSIPSLLAVRT